MPKSKIVLIEDDRTMLSLLRTLLRFEGFEVLQLEQDEDLDEIMRFVCREEPALILLDVNLRQFNGFDLLLRIRARPELRSLRVIMSSGIDFSERCREEGADGFILKPYMPDDLISTMRQVLANQSPSNK